MKTNKTKSPNRSKNVNFPLKINTGRLSNGQITLEYEGYIDLSHGEGTIIRDNTYKIILTDQVSSVYLGLM